MVAVATRSSFVRAAGTIDSLQQHPLPDRLIQAEDLPPRSLEEGGGAEVQAVEGEGESAGRTQ